METKIVELTNEEYHAEEFHLSSSSIKLLLTDLAKFHQEKILGIKPPRVENANFADGSYVHSLILEPEKIQDEYSFFTGWRKAGKEFQEHKEANPGKAIISKPQDVKCRKIAASYFKNPTAVELLKGCESEVSIMAELMGVKVKARCDAVNLEKGYIVDLKTTSMETDKDSFSMAMQRFYYPLSASLYCQIFEAHYGRPFEFLFIVLGKTDFQCRVYKLSKETRENGDLQVLKALKLYKQCLATNNWTTQGVVAEANEDIEEI